MRNLRKSGILAVAGVLIAAGAAVAGVVTSEPSAAPSFNGPVYAVVYRGKTDTIVVEPDFKTDLASVPVFLSALVPVAGRAPRIVHALACRAGEASPVLAALLGLLEPG